MDNVALYPDVCESEVNLYVNVMYIAWVCLSDV